MRTRDSAGVGLRQQGHRGSILRSRRAIRIRIVATDSATWRCARIGSSPRTEAFGYGSDLERESEERNARGGKKTRSTARKPYAAMHKVAWWWKPLHPRPS